MAVQPDPTDFEITQLVNSFEAMMPSEIPSTGY